MDGVFGGWPLGEEFETVSTRNYHTLRNVALVVLKRAYLFKDMLLLTVLPRTQLPEWG
jgi:hypothetical protein